MRKLHIRRLTVATASLAACWGLANQVSAAPCTDIIVTDGGGAGSLDLVYCDLDNDHTIYIEAEGSNTGFVVLVEGFDKPESLRSR